MGKIKKIEQVTHNPYVNLYELETENRVGNPGRYYVASRAKDREHLELSTKVQHPDGVIIYSLYGEKKDRVVLIRQYRYPIDGYIYEFPAGLVEPGEDYHNSAVRELKEETGLTFHPLEVDMSFEKPYYTTIGMTDESCSTVYGYADGQVSADGLEDSEEIEVVLADRAEVRRILKEERVAVVCAYMLMHFLHDEKPFAFLGQSEAQIY
jgi:ADP-ribose pyrophosphatase